MAAEDLQPGVELTEASGVFHSCLLLLHGVVGKKLSEELLKRELLKRELLNSNVSGDSVGRVEEMS